MTEPSALGTLQAWAMRYAEAGWHVLPLEPGGKTPLGKLVPRGMLDATTDLQTIRSWWMRHPQANIGIALAQSGLVAVDVDPRNGGADTFDTLQVQHGSLRSEVSAFTGGGGEHHVFLVPAGVHVSLPGTLGPGVDLKANGYIVVEPSIHPSGKTYAWEASSNPLDGVVPSPLPDWLRGLRVPATQIKQMTGDVPVDAAQARDLREALYVLDSDEYHEWITAGMALHATGWGHPAYAMWCGWAQQSDKFDATVARHKWESFKGPAQRSGGVGPAWIFGQAQQRGWINPAAQVVQIRGQLAQLEPAEQPAESVVLDMATLQLRASAVSWAVKGVIPERGLGYFYGASQAFKSFIALDYALHRAYGMRWMGRKTKQAIPVYLAAEGGAGLLRRIIAWHSYRGIPWQDCPMRVVITPLTLRTKSSFLRQQVHACGIDPGDVIVDTMSQTFTGNENSNDEVAEWLRVLGVELRDGLSCTVSVVHHTGHMATERPRGASAIISNVDFALGIFREDKELLATVEFAKVKDSERPAAVSFELAKVDLGRDEDGDLLQSLTARFVHDGADLQQVLQTESASGRGGRSQALMALVQNGMTERELRKSFYETIEGLDTDSKKKAFYRARDRAVQQRQIEVAEGFVIDLRGRK